MKRTRILFLSAAMITALACNKQKADDLAQPQTNDQWHWLRAGAAAVQGVSASFKAFCRVDPQDL